ncbi:MAG TPA: outer membrane protein assembly factor BamB [Steroidobacteraceae bacterium]
MRRLIAPALALLVLAACSKEKEVNPPAELTEFQPSLRVTRLWETSVGGTDAPLRLGLGVAVDGDRVFAAGHSGDVAAFNLQTGRSVWRTRTRAPLSGGPGAGSGLVAVGSAEGEVIALNASDGQIRWRAKVNGEVLAAPAVSDIAVVVRTVDGFVRALDPATGRERWIYDQPVPRLSLRGTSPPVLSGDLVLCGFDNGKVVALNLRDGGLVWETTVAPSRGRTELERLVDIDSAVKVADMDVYAVGFQGRVAMLALETGQVWWSHEASSYRGLDVDDENVYFSNAQGEVVALRRRTGAEIWRQSALLHRGLSAPVVTDGAIAVADFQGYVHWLDKATGDLLARSAVGGARVSNPPVVANDTLLVINDAGRLAAFRTAPLRQASTAPREEPESEPSAAPEPVSAPLP